MRKGRLKIFFIFFKPKNKTTRRLNKALRKLHIIHSGLKSVKKTASIAKKKKNRNKNFRFFFKLSLLWNEEKNHKMEFFITFLT